MKKIAVFILCAFASSLLATSCSLVEDVAKEALKEADFIVIGYKDADLQPSALVKSKEAIINRYSLTDLPLKQFPEANKVYAYTLVDGVFIEKPDVELKWEAKLK